MASIHRLVPVVVGLTLILTPSLRSDVVFDLSSGYDNDSGQLLPEGAPDKYIIQAGGTGGHWGEVPIVRTTALPGGWLLDGASPDSRWLALDPINVGVGTFFFETYVDLTGFDPSTALITGLRYAADNKLISVEINGVPVFMQPEGYAAEFYDFHPIGDVGQQLFFDGLNVIRFVVLNNPGPPDPNPMGLRVEGLVEADPAGR